MFDASELSLKNWKHCFPCRLKITDGSDRAVLAATKMRMDFFIKTNESELQGTTGDVILLKDNGEKEIVSPEIFSEKYDILIVRDGKNKQIQEM